VKLIGGGSQRLRKFDRDWVTILPTHYDPYISSLQAHPAPVPPVPPGPPGDTGCLILLATPKKNRVPDMGGVLGLCF
jgi:hypothetical protein